MLQSPRIQCHSPYCKNLDTIDKKYVPLPPKYNNSMIFTTTPYHAAHMEEEE